MRPLVVVVALVLVASIAVLLITPTTILPVGEDQLGSSLAGAVGAPEGACEQGDSEDSYLCAVDRDPGSGAWVLYSLKRTDQACWKAQQTTLSPTPRRPSTRPETDACVSIEDYLPWKSVDFPAELRR